MFPKLTSNLLQINLQRVAATQKTQNAQYRTVFQFSPSYPASPLPPTPVQPNSLLTSFNGASSSSSGSGGGAGPEGSRSNPGSRFYEGYTGPGRAVTQANVIASYDGAVIQRDESVEIQLIPKRAKDAAYYVNVRRPHPNPDIRYLRRNSLASGFIGPTRLDRARTFGTLAAVQTRLHGSTIPLRSSPLASQVFTSESKPENVRVALSRNASRRKASTLAATLATAPSDGLPPSLLPQPSPPLDSKSTSNQRANVTKGTDLPSHQPSPLGQAATSLATSDALPALHPEVPEVQTWRSRIKVYTEAGNVRGLVDEIQWLLEGTQDPAFYTTENYSIIFTALVQPRPYPLLRNSNIIPVLELYNQMIAKKIAPTSSIFNSLITVLSVRDALTPSLLAKAEAEAEACRLLHNEVGIAESMTKIESLKSATHFRSAMMLFNSGTSGMRFHLSTFAVNNLLRCAVAHKDLDAAVRLFAYLDRCSRYTDVSGKSLSPLNQYSYRHIIRAYGQVGDVKAALKAFEAYRKSTQKLNADPWHAMIEAYFTAGQPEDAVALLEEMLSVTDADERRRRQIPAPNAFTYTKIVKGFAENGLVTEAEAWLERLSQGGIRVEAVEVPAQSEELELLQADEAEESAISSTPNLTPIPPRAEAWLALLSGLYKKGDLQAFTKYYFQCDARPLVRQEPSGKAWPQPFLSYFIQLSRQAMESLDSMDPAIDTMLESLLLALQSERVRRSKSLMLVKWPMIEVAKLAAGQGRLGVCLRMVETLQNTDNFETTPRSFTTNSGEFFVGVDLTQQLQDSVAIAAVLGRADEELTLAKLFEVAELVKMRGIELFPTGPVLEPYISAFYREVPTLVSEGMTSQRWEILAAAFTQHFQSGNITAEEYENFVKHLKENSLTGSQPSPQLTAIVDEAFLGTLTRESEPKVPRTPIKNNSPLTQANSSPASSEAMFSTASPTSSHSSAATYVTIDSTITWHLSNLNLNFTQKSKTSRPTPTPPPPLESFRVCMSSIERGLYPDPMVISKFLSYLVRGGLYEEAKQLYTATSPLVNNYTFSPQEREKAWYMIENGMMSAAAFAGDVDAANAHRYAMVQRGFAPSAASYGQLIVASKTLTDEASIASELFVESQAMGVPATPFLYNVVISALSRARRAEDALQLFKQMKRQGVLPSSVTYGALIGACARVGDEAMATTLFEEMRRQKTHVPRVPPFNAMMQMYVTAKPDRERALEYYRMMLQCRLQPTEHTYKLLLDAHGTIEPFDLAGMEKLFASLQQDPKVSVSGAHYASMINAYGCVAKDLDRAISQFESIPATSPSAKNTTPILPDVLCYEALFLVFVAHKRPDLVASYLERFKASHMQMTAYVANVVIKALAASGDLEGARKVFESMEDPATGFAVSKTIRPVWHGDIERSHEGEYSPEGPIYREPSTWEMMIRVEIGAGERERALEIFDRMVARHYPELVVQRARDLLHPPLEQHQPEPVTA